ncbi:MAG: chalcone isomerase family protein [Bacteroidota bacterium]|nr:chalcone isomerase family protein [Bacteroidota bacterium]
MKKVIFYFCILTIMFQFLCLAQQTVKESSTGKFFPTEITFKQDGNNYILKLTGLAVRKKLFFKVYGIAHYIQDAANYRTESEAFRAILIDGKAKQITMDFARDADAVKIKEAYTDGFKQHATGEEMKIIQPLVNKFVSYFSKDVKENEQFILRWLPGGSVVAILHGEEKQVITNGIFARVLWSIWFGEDSIVDRNKLVERIVGK